MYLAGPANVYLMNALPFSLFIRYSVLAINALVLDTCRFGDCMRPCVAQHLTLKFGLWRRQYLF